MYKYILLHSAYDVTKWLNYNKLLVTIISITDSDNGYTIFYKDKSY